MAKKKSAAELHENVPPDWYFRSIKENPLQNYWHTHRFQEAAKLMELVKGNVLDIGSADGVFTKVVADNTKAQKVIGVDILKSSVDWANKHWKKHKNMRFRVADAHKLPFKAGSFDAAFSFEMLEHVYHPDKVLTEIKRVLKKGGYAVFLVPTDVWWFKLGWDYFWTKTRGKIWNDTHIQSYKDDNLVSMCEKAGFRVEKNKKFLLGMLQAVKVRKG